MDPNLNSALNAAKLRHQAMSAIRDYFSSHNFIEIDAPILIPANAVETHIDPLAVSIRLGDQSQTRYLQTSPELYLKRLLCRGLERIYCLSHVFRDGERGVRHLPEFAMLEWYRARSHLEELITDCEKVFTSVANACSAPEPPRPYDRVRMQTLWETHAKTDLRTALVKMADGDQFALVRAALEAGFSLRPNADFEDAFHHVMMVAIEPNIGQDRPCVVLEWPKQMAALAQTSDRDPLFADRFEIYFRGLELANAFLELIDPVEQKQRFIADLEARHLLGKAAIPMPNAFLSDLISMPPSVGIAVGFDRLLMALTQKSTIDLIYPLPW